MIPPPYLKVFYGIFKKKSHSGGQTKICLNSSGFNKVSERNKKKKSKQATKIKSYKIQDLCEIDPTFIMVRLHNLSNGGGEPFATGGENFKIICFLLPLVLK